MDESERSFDAMDAASQAEHGLLFVKYAEHGTPDYASKTAIGCEATSEPVFLLRAQDKHAPEAVRTWAAEVEEAGNHRMAAEALRIADQMERWSSRKEPD